MFLLPRTVAYRSAGRILFRRVRGVVKAEWRHDTVRLTTRRGQTIDIPAFQTVIAYGRKVSPAAAK